MIYAFVCQGCGKSFDLRATMAERERGIETLCPHCGSKDTKQDFRGIGMIFGAGGRGSPPICGPGAGGGCC